MLSQNTFPFSGGVSLLQVTTTQLRKLHYSPSKNLAGTHTVVLTGNLLPEHDGGVPVHSPVSAHTRLLLPLVSLYPVVQLYVATPCSRVLFVVTSPWSRAGAGPQSIAETDKGRGGVNV